MGVYIGRDDLPDLSRWQALNHETFLGEVVELPSRRSMIASTAQSCRGRKGGRLEIPLAHHESLHIRVDVLVVILHAVSAIVRNPSLGIWRRALSTWRRRKSSAGYYTTIKLGVCNRVAYLFSFPFLYWIGTLVISSRTATHPQLKVWCQPHKRPHHHPAIVRAGR